MTKLQLYQIQSSTSGWYRRGELNSEVTYDSRNVLVCQWWAIKLQADIWRTLVCYMCYVLVLYFQVEYAVTCQASWYWLIFHTIVMPDVVSCLECIHNISVNWLIWCVFYIVLTSFFIIFWLEVSVWIDPGTLWILGHFTSYWPLWFAHFIHITFWQLAFRWLSVIIVTFLLFNGQDTSSVLTDLNLFSAITTNLRIKVHQFTYSPSPEVGIEPLLKCVHKIYLSQWIIWNMRLVHSETDILQMLFTVAVVWTPLLLSSQCLTGFRLW